MSQFVDGSQNPHVERALAAANDPSGDNPFATMADASSGSLPAGWTETADGVEVTGVGFGNTFLKVTRQGATATGNVGGTEVFAAFLRIYNSILFDDAALLAKNDNGDVFFELDTTANARDGAVKVHGAEITSGAPGADGASFLGDAHVPDGTTDGIDGNTYLDTSTGLVYGPKAAGAWGASTGSLIGADGPSGPAGVSFITGAGDPDNTTDGVDGDSYLNTSNGAIYGPKAAGVWGSAIASLSDFALVPDDAYYDIADTATLVQGSGSAVLGVSVVKVKRLGRQVHARICVEVASGTGETGEPWLLTPPAAFAAAENVHQLNGPCVAGNGIVVAGAAPFAVTALWSGAAEGASALTLVGHGGEVGSDMALQLLTGAVVQLNLVYEAAAAA